MVRLNLPEWFMDKYRGTPGFFGRLVFEADVQWIKDIAKAVKDHSR
jgi:hypothetical protein